MPDVSISAHVFPSANDLFISGAQSAGAGKVLSEQNLADYWLASLLTLAGGSVNHYVISGGVLPASSANLTLAVPAVTALIAGRIVRVTSSTNLTLPASATSYIFLKALTDANGNISSVAFEHNTTGAVPANAVELGWAVTNASQVTSTVDNRPLYGREVTFTSSGTWRVPGGLTSVLAEVWGAGGGGGGGGSGHFAGCVSYRGAPGHSGAPGGYAAGRLTVTPGTSHTVTIAAGGTPGSGAPPGGEHGSAGAAAGTTSLGTLLSATGGGGGGGGVGSTHQGDAGTPGSPGVGIGGSLQLTGGGAAGGQGGVGSAAGVGGGNGSAGGQGRVRIRYQ